MDVFCCAWLRHRPALADQPAGGDAPHPGRQPGHREADGQRAAAGPAQQPDGRPGPPTRRRPGRSPRPAPPTWPPPCARAVDLNQQLTAARDQAADAEDRLAKKSQVAEQLARLRDARKEQGRPRPPGRPGRPAARQVEGSTAARSCSQGPRDRRSCRLQPPAAQGSREPRPAVGRLRPPRRDVRAEKKAVTEEASACGPPRKTASPASR